MAYNNCMSKVTIRDIAREAGVSKAAVSYVINDKKGVGDETRKKIEDVIEKYDYRPNFLSKNLAHGKNFSIHAVIRREAAPACKAFYFNVIAQMIEQVEGSISVVPMFQSDNTIEDQNLLELARSSSTDGVIAFQGVRPEIRAELEKREIPYIIINPGIEKTDVASVILDFELLAYQATSYLVKQGHHKIGMIGMACMPLFFDQTRRGFLRAMEQAGIQPNGDWIRGEADCEAGAAIAMEHMLESGTPTAVFCSQDNFAISAMHVCVSRGLRVPEDVSFIAIDDVPEAQYMNPPLTTIPVSPEEIAEVALSLIFQKMKDGSCESVVLPSRDIVVRESVRFIRPERP
jgi:DNA-binding LacI/PurR family transcriptional regulator